LAKAPAPPNAPTTRKPATTKPVIEPGVERVDFLVDEEGEVVNLPEAAAPEIEEEIEEAVEATSPSAWFGWGLFALGGIIALLGLLQAISRATTG